MSIPEANTAGRGDVADRPVSTGPGRAVGCGCDRQFGEVAGS